MALRVDYSEIAPTYDARYALGPYDGVRAALRALLTGKNPEYTLEAGCGTGYWMSALGDLVLRSYGLDHSLEMLRKAHERDSRGALVRATAEVLPFREATFDLIFCINAIHHFQGIEQFIAEARRLLRPGVAAIGMDPHHGRDYWCVYDYFPETKPFRRDAAGSRGVR
jgi:ubiquinone/menaquinone biosynthesis C-methylase UbiE